MTSTTKFMITIEKERKKGRWTRRKRKGIREIKWQTARISFFQRLLPPPPSFFCSPAARRAPSPVDPLKTLKYSLVNFLGFREKSVAREKRAWNTRTEREREEGGGPACPSAPRQTQEEIRFCFHPVIFSRASTPPRFVFVNDATSLREAHFGRYRNRIKILFVSRSRSVKIQREK